jgi:hypothetical protein
VCARQGIDDWDSRRTVARPAIGDSDLSLH